MARSNFRRIGMDTMERLYYERKDFRRKRYESRNKNISARREVSAKRHQMKQDSRALEKAVWETLDHQLEEVC